jgi:DNA polymerase III delta prime subunit
MQNKQKTYDPFYSAQLFGLNNYFYNLRKNYELNNLPNVTMLSGKKGIGKFTLVNHFLISLFDGKNYDLDNLILNKDSEVYAQHLNNTFQNIIVLNRSDTNKIKMEDVRNLKNILSNSIMNFLPRFIVIDNVDQLTVNVANALLKILEEPTGKNFFILINNQEGNILETINSRTIETKLFISDTVKISIIKKLIQYHDLKEIIDYKNIDVTPGNFLTYNNLCLDNDISLESNYIDEIYKILNLYKKSKNRDFIKFSFFLTNLYFFKLTKKNINNIFLFDKLKSDTIKLINDYAIYNLNLSTVLNTIHTKIKNEK